jgi:preprotein translocase subunit SecG
MTKTNSLQDILANLQKNTPNKLVYSSKLSSLHTKEFFTKHSTFSYSLKRILISLICLFIGITLIFLLVRYSLEKMGINAFMPEASDKAG